MTRLRTWNIIGNNDHWKNQLRDEQGMFAEKPAFIYKSKSKMPESQQRSKAGVLLGTTTSDGVMITDISEHAYDRMMDRGLGASQIKDVLENGIPSPSKTYANCTVYTKRFKRIGGVRVVVNHKTGLFVTITREDDDRRYERRR